MLWHASRFSSLRSSFEFHRPVYVGGAMRVPMTVGDAVLDIVIDTGAAAPLSVSSSALERIGRCLRPPTARRAVQRGVNGENVCSDAFSAPVSVGRIDLGWVECLANAGEVEGADGYAGLGLLRMLDLWIAPDEVGFRLSGLPAGRSSALSPGSCDGNAIGKSKCPLSSAPIS